MPSTVVAKLRAHCAECLVGVSGVDVVQDSVIKNVTLIEHVITFSAVESLCKQSFCYAKVACEKRFCCRLHSFYTGDISSHGTHCMNLSAGSVSTFCEMLPSTSPQLFMCTYILSHYINKSHVIEENVYGLFYCKCTHRYIYPLPHLTVAC